MQQILKYSYLLVVLLCYQSYLSAQSRISRIEYFVDSDPGIGNGVLLSFTNLAADTSLTFQVNTSSLAIGLHKLFVRTQDSAGKNSVVQNRSFFIIPTNPGITNMEYFVDADPGIGNGQQIAISPTSNDTSLSFNLNTSSLGVGLHTLYVRTKNSLGQYSVVQRQSFFVTPTNPMLSSAEYFIDNDPGVGNGQQIAITPNTNDTSLSFNLNTASLNPGLHTLYVRTKNNIGQYSIVQRQSFFVTPTNPILSSVEYFIDNDPGVGNGQQITITPNANDTSLSFNLNTSSINPGLHTLYVRTKNNIGQYSVVERQRFFILPTNPSLVGVEYFIDTDPGFGNGQQISINPNAMDTTLALMINTSGITAGYHRLFVRTKDQTNHWSVVQVTRFYHLISPAKPKKVEYFIDNDPGFGNGQSVSLNNEGDTAIANFNINLSAVTLGNHKLFFRIQDSLGNWGIAEDSNFCKKPGAKMGIPVSVCAGQTFTIINSSTDTNSQTTYSWDFGNNGTIDRTRKDTVQLTLSDTGYYAIKLVINTPGTCAKDSTISSIYVSPVKVLSTIITASANNACAGTNIQFVAVPTNGGSSPTFQWRRNGINISGATDDTLNTTTLANKDTISCMVSSSLSSCIANNNLESNKIVMNIASLSTPSIGITANKINLCLGGPFVFTANLTNGGSTPKIAWYKNNNILLGDTGLTLMLNSLAKNDSVHATLISSAACLSTSNVSSNKIGIDQITLDSAKFSSASNGFCSGGNVMLSADTLSGRSYKWLYNGNEIQNANASIYAANLAGNYQSIITNPFGCSDTSDAMVISMHASPVVILSQTSDTSFCEGGSFNLSVDTSVISSASYRWQHDQTNTNITTPQITIIQSGSYRTIVTSLITGCQTTSAAINFTIAQLPSVALNSSGKVSICAGSSTTISASMGNNLLYQWMRDSIDLIGETARNFTTSNDGLYRVRVTNTMTQCANTSDSVIVQVNAKPSLSVNGGSSKTNFCLSDTVNLKGTTNGGAMPYAYTWFNNNIAIQTNDIIKISQTGNYRLVVIDSLGCRDSSQLFGYLFHAYPSANIQVDGNLNYCIPIQSLVLSADTGIGNTYIWHKSDYDPTNNAQEPDTILSISTASINNPTWGKYYVEVVSSSGCTSKSTSVTVNAYTKPTATLSASSGVTICEGEPINISYSPSTFGSIQSLLLNDSVYVNIETDSTTYLVASGTYKLVASIPNIVGCSDTSSNSFSATIKETPSAKLAVVNAQQCLKDNLFLFYPENGLQNPEGTSYTYFFGDGQSKVQPATDHTYLNAGSYLVTLIAVNQGNCVDTNATEVIVGSQPTASFTVNNTSICESDGDFTFTNTGTPSDSTNTVLWQLGDGTLLSGNTFTHAFEEVGNYMVTLSITSADGCVGIDSISVSLNPKPKANFDYTIVGSSVGFINQTKIGAGTFTNSWDLGNGEKSIANALTYNYAQTGNYLVGLTVLSDKGCVDSISKTIAVTLQPIILYLPYFPSAGGSFFTAGGYTLSATIGELTMVNTFGDSLKPIILTQGFQQPDDFYNIINGIEEMDVQPPLVKGVFTFYPNPTDGPLNIGYEFNSSGQVTGFLYDQIGRLITVLIDEPYTGGLVNKTFDMFSYSDGIYYVRTVFKGDQEVTHTKKLIVIH